VKYLVQHKITYDRGKNDGGAAPSAFGTSPKWDAGLGLPQKSGHKKSPDEVD
jgi:hypothetical protein